MNKTTGAIPFMAGRRSARSISTILFLVMMFEAMPVDQRSQADNTAQPVPFDQDWSNTGLIATNNDWGGVPAITGYQGEGLVSSAGIDPQTITADGSTTTVNVLANRLNPDTLTTGGVAEFDGITNPTVALQGSGTARAPHIVININTTGQTGITISYKLRDIDGSADNAVQPVALQYRTGTTGSFINIPAGFVADATTGPGQATMVTPVFAALPPSADNQPLVQVRIITSDAQGSDEWVGIDDIEVRAVLAPTLARLNSFAATEQGGKVSIRWESGYESDNLGYNIYREIGGERTLITPDLVAGSAFLAAPGVALQAGMSYSWSDILPENARDVQYLLEDIDLNGQTTWHGPFAVEPVKEKAASHGLKHSPLLGETAKWSGAFGGSFPVTLSATMPMASPGAFVEQTSLAAGAAIKLSIKHAGLYRVSQADLLAAGLSPAIDPRLLQLFVDGRQIPCLVSGEDDGRLDPSDYVEFFGVGLDSQFSISRTYWLIEGLRPGLRIASSPVAIGSPSPPSFPFSVERRDKVFFFSSLLNGEEDNFFGSVIPASPLDQSLRLSNISASPPSDALVEVSLQGVTLVPHRVAVSLNGSSIGTIFFSNREKGSISASVPHSLLREGDNTITLARQGGSSDVSLVEAIRITYQHAFRADSDALSLTGSGGQTVSIAGFTAAPVRLFDVTDKDFVEQLPAAVAADKSGTFTISATAVGEGERRLFAVSDSLLRRPEAITANAPSRWQAADNGADLVIFTRRDLMNGFSRLKQYRQGRGMSVAVVDVEDVYDEFSFGHKSPHAIKEFLSTARRWKRAPKFVLLGGDGTFDPNNYVGGGAGDVVPIKLVETETMETASDEWYADFDNDGVGEMMVGRLPVRTADEASKLTDKIIAYERGRARGSAVFVSDTSEGFDFEAASEEIRRETPEHIKTTAIYRGRIGDEAAKAALVEAVNAGQKVVNYFGHGTLTGWRGGLMGPADAAGFTDRNSLSIFVAMTCLNGLFHNPTGDSLAEALMKAEGGAVAVWASSGLTSPSTQTVMNREALRLIFDSPATTIGEAANRARSVVNDRNIRRTWLLFGDPSIRIR